MFRLTRSLILPSSCRHLATRKMADKLVWIDCEMTGLNVDKDKLLEVALIITDMNLNTVIINYQLIICVTAFKLINDFLL